jgi:CDP-glycerol glycerophosphotransferase
MVLLEALTLKLPVLATNIPANLSVLKDYASEYIEGFSSEDIAQAILRSIEEKNHIKCFNYLEYNNKAMKSFSLEVDR